MAAHTERETGTVHWFGLLSPERGMERRAKTRGFWDAWRDVRSQDPDLAQRLAGPGERRRDGFYYVESEADWYPPVTGEIASWTTSTLQALGAVAKRVVGEHNARIEGLKARIEGKDSMLSGSQPSPDAPPPGAGLPDDKTGGASRPAAQARRRERLAAQSQAAAQGSLIGLRVELAEAIALRAATVEPLRETARQVRAFGDAIQHLYWAVRIRWSRRRHGGKPIAAYVIVPWPAWVIDDDALFDVQPKTAARAA